MTTLAADVAVLGAGFGGSLTSLLLERIGLRAVLIDRGRHPRFAIGESSTPIADLVLRDLALRYDLPRLTPLACYGTWKETYPQLVCGRKRGFSYFHHALGCEFWPRDDHAGELLVAASSDDAYADTHWLRSDVDAFLVQEVQRTGVPYLDETNVTLSASDDGCLLTGDRRGGAVRVRARFVIDATGEAGVLRSSLAIPDRSHTLSTRSRAIYGHFENVRPWREVLVSTGANIEDHPFHCDDAALHHILDEGWMWQLRFDNGVTSAGFVLDSDQRPRDEEAAVAQEWEALLRQYPSVAEQFTNACLSLRPGRLLRSGRLQRLASRMAGANWALLPSTAGFVDPLHSTGIAQTLCGIERLVQIFGDHWGRPSLGGRLECYEKTLQQEMLLIDRLVSGCYLARQHPRLFAAFCMLYFAAATTYEHRRHARHMPAGAAFLCADDPTFCRLVDDLWRRLRTIVSSGTCSEPEVGRFERRVREAIKPYDRVGLGDPNARNMYRHAAAPHK